MSATQHAEAVRSARRRRLWMLAATMPLALALGVLGTRFVLLMVATDRAEAAYAQGRYAQAADGYGSQTWLNLVDPWKVHYNKGTAQVQEGTPASITAAIDTLERAYGLTKSAHADVQCLVQTNLALAYEIDGDLQTADAETAEADRTALLGALADRTRGAPFDQALLDTYTDRLGVDPTEEALDDYVTAALDAATASYQAALDARARPGCLQSTPEDQQGNDEASERVSDKLGQEDDSEKESGEDPSPSPSPSPSPDPSQDPEEAERQQKLQDLGKDAEREAYEDQQLIEDTYGDGTGGFVPKRW